VIYDDAQDALAAEYVLGTLSAEEREHAEALLAIDPGFAESVRQWERRLGELNVMVEAVEPPPAVWEKIRAEIVGGTAPPEDIPLSTIAAGIADPPPEATPSVETPGASQTPEPVASEAVNEQPASSPPPTEQLSDSLSDSIAATLAKSLAEPAAVPPPPPPAVEAKIERSATVIQLSRRVSRWRRMTVAVAALAAALALYIALAQFAPGLIPFGPLASQQVAQSQPPAPLSARLVAVLQQEPTAPAFLLTVDPQSRTMIVRRVSATPEPGRSYQLWLIAKQFPAPRSLGLVGDDEYTQRDIPGNFDMETLRSARYAVSLEPAGGSPSGVPTGPVLFTGNIVQSVPASPPAATPKT
jgi:anti-sigma-K factor RskA